MSDTKIDNSPGYMIYQEMCDEIYGKDAVKIKKDSPWNSVTFMITCGDIFEGFVTGFKNRLIRLKKRFEGTPHYKALLQTVAQIGDWNLCDNAYAKLAAWDILWNNYLMLGMELNKKVKRTDAYSGSMYRNLPVKDGFLPDSGLYFDAGLMGDTVGRVMDVVISVVVRDAKLPLKCEVKADYPWDDDETAYKWGTRDRLYDELMAFLKTTVSVEMEEVEAAVMEFQSKVMPQLKYTISWGQDAEQDEESEKDSDPYYLAEQTKDLMFKRFAENFMPNNMFMQVLVSSPYFPNYHKGFYHMHSDYYELLAYYTFCEHTGDETKLRKMIPGYLPGETLDEVSRSLAGFIVIDDGIDKDCYQCHVYMNPNATHKNKLADFYLDTLNCERDDLGILGSFLEYMGGAL